MSTGNDSNPSQAAKNILNTLRIQDLSETARKAIRLVERYKDPLDVRNTAKKR